MKVCDTRQRGALAYIGPVRMPVTIQLNPELLTSDPLKVGSSEFRATIRAHGEYMPLAYVLRLSPLVHQTLAALPHSGIVASQEIGLDGAQAFSTYLHETIHWWQHAGSTYGLMRSLSYPTQVHGNYKHLRELIATVGFKKPVRTLARVLPAPGGMG